MVLVVFCHSGLAYKVPKSLIKEIQRNDIALNEGSGDEVVEATKFFNELEKKYKPIVVGYLLTGDVG